MSVSPPPTPGLQNSFDDNTDDLLHLLTDSWDSPLKNNITDSKWTHDYLTKLTSLPLDELVHEPAALREEQAKAKSDAQKLAFRDYPSFLHAQICRHEAEETLDGLHVHLGEFLSSVPELQQACQEFADHAKDLKEERGKITSVLEHQNVLTDLLEIPQLMETCVWNGYYSEAMDLASHVRLLQVRYPLSVIKSIQRQVQASTDLMLVQLISHLRKPIRLAAAMNVVGFLRRMDVFGSETELRMVFLRCRHDFLQQRLVRVKRDMSEDTRQRSADAFEYLKRFVDVMREQMFEIGTQYISIFSNEQDSLLSDYMVHIIGSIKSALHTYLPMIEDISAVASLLTQLQYCGMSLGRIGLDFRHVFVHSFEEAVQPVILKWIDAATEDLAKRIIKSTEEASAPSTWMSSKIVSQSGGQSTNEVRRHAFQPPMLLVGYPSLAIFTNGILSAFNALRLLPALSLYIPIQNHLDACFLEIGNALKQYADQAVIHIPDEITYLQSFSAAYVRCCVPYLKSCLIDGIYCDLSVPYVPGDDLELLLLDYLPVVKKDQEISKLEDTKLDQKLENSSVNEKELCDLPQEAVSKLITPNEGSEMQASTTPALEEPVDQDPISKNISQDDDEAKNNIIDNQSVEPTAENVEDVVEKIEEVVTSEGKEDNVEQNVNVDEEIVKREAQDAIEDVIEPAVEEAVDVAENSVEEITEKNADSLADEREVEETTENAIDKLTDEKTIENTIAEEAKEVEVKILEAVEKVVEEAVEEAVEGALEEAIEKNSVIKEKINMPNEKEDEKEAPVTEPILEDSSVEYINKTEEPSTVGNVQDNTSHAELAEKNTNIPETTASTEHMDEKEESVKISPEKKASKKSKKQKGKKGKR